MQVLIRNEPAWVTLFHFLITPPPPLTLQPRISCHCLVRQIRDVTRQDICLPQKNLGFRNPSHCLYPEVVFEPVIPHPAIPKSESAFIFWSRRLKSRPEIARWGPKANVEPLWLRSGSPRHKVVSLPNPTKNPKTGLKSKHRQVLAAAGVFNFGWSRSPLSVGCYRTGLD